MWFDTIGNTDVNAIEDGNTFEGFPTSGRYVVGEVLDATDFDVDDSTKAKLYIDNN